MMWIQWLKAHIPCDSSHVTAENAGTAAGRRAALRAFIAPAVDWTGSLVVPAGQRERLERVCRYALRPPVAIERLHLTGDGRVTLLLR